MGLSSGIARAHRLIQLTASQDSSTNLVWPNGFQPGWEARGWKQWTFQFAASGTVTTPSITIYGTVDPNTARGTAAVPRWFALVSPAAAPGTAGTNVNPITAVDGSQSLIYASALEAFRIVTNAFTGGGTVIVDVDMVA